MLTIFTEPSLVWFDENVNRYAGSFDLGVEDPAALLARRLSFDEGEQIRVEHSCIHGKHAVGKGRVGLQGAMLEQLDRL